MSNACTWGMIWIALIAGESSNAASTENLLAEVLEHVPPYELVWPETVELGAVGALKQGSITAQLAEICAASSAGNDDPAAAAIFCYNDLIGQLLTEENIMVSRSEMDSFRNSDQHSQEPLIPQNLPEQRSCSREPRPHTFSCQDCFAVATEAELFRSFFAGEVGTQFTGSVVRLLQNDTELMGQQPGILDFVEPFVTSSIYERVDQLDQLWLGWRDLVPEFMWEVDHDPWGIAQVNSTLRQQYPEASVREGQRKLRSIFADVLGPFFSRYLVRPRQALPVMFVRCAEVPYRKNSDIYRLSM